MSGNRVEFPAWLDSLEALSERSDAELLQLRDDALWDSLQSSTAETMAQELSDRLARLIDSDPTALWLVITTVESRASNDRVEFSILRETDADLRSDGRVLRVSRELSMSERDVLLATPGVERILQGEARQRLGCDHQEAGECMVVAEEGWSFDDDAVASAREAWLFVLGSPAPELCANWPKSIHDIRVAPTIATWLDRPTDAFADTALG